MTVAQLPFGAASALLSGGGQVVKMSRPSSLSFSQFSLSVTHQDLLARPHAKPTHQS